MLLACPNPAQIIREFGEAVACSAVTGTTSVIYTRGASVHEGSGAKLRPYWRRIVSAGQQGAVWSSAEADLPGDKDVEAVRLTGIAFAADEVRQFIAQRTPPKPKRGPERDQDHWAPFWIEVAKLGKRGLLNEGSFRSQAAFRKRLADNLPAFTRGDEAMKPFAARVWKEVVMITPADLGRQEKTARS